jgi:hypothetical protein
MNVNTLYRLASLLDTDGKYLEADVVLESMMRLAAGPEGRGKYQGRARPRDLNPRLTPEQLRARLNPNAPQGIVPVQSTPPVAQQAPRVQQAPTQLTPKQLLRQFQASNANIKNIEEYLARNNYPREQFIQYYNEVLGEGRYEYDIDRYKATGQGGPSLDRRQVKPSTRPQGMSDTAYRRILNKFNNIDQLEDYLKTDVDRESFIAKYNEQFGPGAYEKRLMGGAGPARQQPRGQQPGGQASGRPGPGTNSSGNSGRGGTNPGAGAGSANNAGGGARPSGAGGSASARPQPGAPVGNTPPGAAGARPSGAPGNAAPGAAGARPYNLGQMNNDVRMRVWNNRNLNPRLYDLLELEYSAGRFNPKTGDLVESAVESLGRAFEKGGPTVVSKGGSGAQMAEKAAEFAARAKNAPGAQSISNALGKMGKTLSFLKPLTKLLPFLGFALSIPDFVRLCNRINQEGWEPIWNDPYDRAKAIGAISNTVAAAVSIAPGPLTPVAAALAAIGMGSDLGADAAVKAADVAEGGEFKLFGKTLKQKSQQRQQQDAFEAGYNAKNIDPQVQSALDASKRMIMSGSKIIDIMNDPKMKSIYTWLGTGDARDTQFKVQVTALRKSLRAGGGEVQPGQGQQQGLGPYLNKPPYSGPANQQGQPVYNNAQQAQQAQQQQKQPLRNPNDLLYKAYVDTVQTTNVTLENLKNYREQIITKINNLAPMYPNINAQQAITALDNRIRKYSGQAQAQPA